MKRTPYKKHLFALCAEFLIWLVFLVLHLSNYNYIHPYIFSVDNLVNWTVPNLILPLIPMAIGLLFVRLDKAIASKVCCVLFLPCLLLSYVRGTTEILYMPSVCSYTSEADNFGLYDEQLGSRISLNPVCFFPSEIPNNVRDVQYCYYYVNSSSETVYIVISWEFASVDDYSLAVSDIQKQHADAENGVLHLEDGLYANAVLFGEEDLRIAYVIASSSELLPTSMDELLASITR